MNEGGDEEINRLTQILQSIPRSSDVNLLTSIRGNAKNVSVSEKGDSKIYN